MNNYISLAEYLALKKPKLNICVNILINDFDKNYFGKNKSLCDVQLKSLQPRTLHYSSTMNEIQVFEPAAKLKTNRNYSSHNT